MMNDNISLLRGRFLLIVLIMISLLLITACGGSGSSDDANGSDTANADTEATVEGADFELAEQEAEDIELNVPNANELYEAARNSTDGEELFITFCAKCHGLQGYGDGPSAGSLHIEGNFALTALGDRSDEELLETIKFGKAIDMPAWGLLLSDEQIEIVLAYVRALSE